MHMVSMYNKGTIDLQYLSFLHLKYSKCSKWNDLSQTETKWNDLSQTETQMKWHYLTETQMRSCAWFANSRM